MQISHMERERFGQPGWDWGYHHGRTVHDRGGVWRHAPQL